MDTAQPSARAGPRVPGAAAAAATSTRTRSDRPGAGRCGVGAALQALVGAAALRSQLVADDFVRRLVVNVDNLGRAHAAPRLWPAHATPGRLRVIERDGCSDADPDNSLRYALLLLAERIDPRAAVALYGRMLPLVQAAYEELGDPSQRFHTPLMAAIDPLLATPDAPELIELKFVEVRGEVPSERPWVRYEFAAQAFEAASAGQKIMLRVGAPHLRRLKAQLRSLRAELVRQAQP